MSEAIHTLPTRLADCLKRCYLLRERGEPMTAHGVLPHLQALEKSGTLSSSVVTHTFERLHNLGYVTHTRYKGVEFTEAGEQAAAELVRHYRLLQLFLVRTLGMPLDQVHVEAERIEHALSEGVEERIDAFLGFPTEDPHGDPIPDNMGHIHLLPSFPLTQLVLGQQAIICRLPTQDGTLIRYLDSLGLVPGVVVELAARTSYDDVLTLRLGEQSTLVSTSIAEQVLIRLSEDPLAHTSGLALPG